MSSAAADFLNIFCVLFPGLHPGLMDAGLSGLEAISKQNITYQLVAPFRAGACWFYFHLNVFIKCFISATKNAVTGFSESWFGVASKYNAPRRKFFVESVRKNWLPVATLPSTLKNMPCTPLGVSISESPIKSALSECLLVRLKASFSSFSSV